LRPEQKLAQLVEYRTCPQSIVSPACPRKTHARRRGVWLGYPLVDPVVGLLITAAIFGIVVQSEDRPSPTCSTGLNQK
jgi:hypothetical protein